MLWTLCWVIYYIMKYRLNTLKRHDGHSALRPGYLLTISTCKAADFLTGCRIPPDLICAGSDLLLNGAAWVEPRPVAWKLAT